jgi:hypothetical protein
MNAPVVITREELRLANIADPKEAVRIEAFVSSHPDGSVFHRPLWQHAVAEGTGNAAHALVCERRGEIRAILPLTEVHSRVALPWAGACSRLTMEPAMP